MGKNKQDNGNTDPAPPEDFHSWEMDDDTPAELGFPSRIFSKDNLYFAEAVRNGMVTLPVNVNIKTSIIAVDTEDVFHVRLYENSGGVVRFGPRSFYKMQVEMDAFFSNPRNKISNRYGANGWFPQVDEVIIVRVLRNKDILMDIDATVRKCFYRARVFEVLKDGVTVQLLDDYGKGGVLYEDVYKIAPRWTHLPPQIFTCELADIEVLNFRKVVNKTMSKFPIQKEAAVFRLKHLGKVSSQGRPFVEISWCTFEARKYLREFIFKHLSFIMNPFQHLGDLKIPTVGSQACKIIRISSKGNMWLQFNQDRDIMERVNSLLDNALPQYEKHKGTVSFAGQLPHLVKSENKKNAFVALIHYDFGVRKLERVRIVRFNPKTEMITVRSIDFGSSHKVHSSEIVPVSIVCPDLVHFPPLLLKVHLCHIYCVDVEKLENDDIHDVLLNESVRAALVFESECLSDVLPEVAIYPVGEDECLVLEYAIGCKHLLGVNGLARYLMNRHLAEANYFERRTSSSYAERLGIEWREKKRLGKKKFIKDTPFMFYGDDFLFAWPWELPPGYVRMGWRR